MTSLFDLLCFCFALLRFACLCCSLLCFALGNIMSISIVMIMIIIIITIIIIRSHFGSRLKERR